MTIDRRSLLKYAGVIPLMGPSPRLVRAAADQADEKVDYTLRIGTGLVELAAEHIVSTTLYNGQFPGPLLRFKEGQRVVVDVHNDTDTPELVHWHGLMIPSDVDGAAEEGSPYVPAHSISRIAFVPKPSGFRFYHTHVVPRGDLNRGTYTGQAGPLYIEPQNNPGAYDRRRRGTRSRGRSAVPISPRALRWKSGAAASHACLGNRFRRAFPCLLSRGSRLTTVISDLKEIDRMKRDHLASVLNSADLAW